MTPTSHDEHLLKTLTLAVVNRPRATMKELAQLAGVSKATLHRYCGTRENLEHQLEAYAEGTLERIIKSAGLQHAEPLEALRRLIREHLAHRELLAFLMVQYRPDFLDFERGDARWRPYIEALDAFFLRGQQKGVFRIDITAAIFSELFITLIYGMVDAEQRGRAANANSARTLEQMFLHGALCSGVSNERSPTPETALWV
ncbi:TetR/AcrR family transcriptional regulator [Pseudomonas chlororaphis]|uniref:TetR/AcrR family transcriptional regulator n=1 Tax=Pseudomonas chlororaphis TaxID=587753 RepID=UPI000F556C38|nr:TetR/AcrR family transcriptional regulator [Pseudomonas chlororaphis]AZC76047.1 Transcriptional regulator NfxB [Pseudomonas chlororaphis subsp. piscium]AZD22351.1 Transcriptional regulator NfxB [Pseudomonas chlororaphis subsp. aurantiaca]AZD48571.1 Transcriptional regulator NfxB [Pseudomonas chlororaphis subsp. aurantiaca]AZD86148.1 Transcriptional regulator NfxB [Pseudomonas chlororaphis subsp. aureofaciens]AZE11465.1 Transcriptional regulator NfxB [Pseudomonas chlororaphis subsp. aureofac